jgi:hypothetical protein
MYVVRYTIIKANKRRFIIKKPIDRTCWIVAAIMLGSFPLSYIYYLIDQLVKKG